MNPLLGARARDGFCIFIDTLFQGPVPVVSDEVDKYVVFETELEAQKEIAEHTMLRIQDFLDGGRDFEDAVKVEEYVVSVTVYPCGTITDENGNSFAPYVM